MNDDKELIRVIEPILMRLKYPDYEGLWIEIDEELRENFTLIRSDNEIMIHQLKVSKEDKNKEYIDYLDKWFQDVIEIGNTSPEITPWFISNTVYYKCSYLEYERRDDFDSTFYRLIAVTPESIHDDGDFIIYTFTSEIDIEWEWKRGIKDEINK